MLSVICVISVDIYTVLHYIIIVYQARSQSHKIIVNNERFDNEIKRKKYIQWNVNELFYWIKLKMNWVKDYDNQRNVDYVFEDKMTKYLTKMKEYNIDGKKVNVIVNNDKLLIDVGFTFTERKNIKIALKELVKGKGGSNPVVNKVVDEVKVNNSTVDTSNIDKSPINKSPSRPPPFIPANMANINRTPSKSPKPPKPPKPPAFKSKPKPPAIVPKPPAIVPKPPPPVVRKAEVKTEAKANTQMNEDELNDLLYNNSAKIVGLKTKPKKKRKPGDVC